MQTRLYNSSVTLARVDNSSYTVISQKIYDYDINKIKAFIISLLLHITLLAILFIWSPEDVIKPLQTESAPIMVSLVAPSVQKKAQKSPQTKTPPPVQKQTKRVHKPKKVLKKAPKPVVKKSIVKKEMPKVEPIVKKVVEPVIEKQTLQKEVVTPTKPLPHSEVFQTQSEPKEPAVSATTLGKIRSLIQNSLVYPAIARRMKIEGVVVVSFVLTQEGYVESAKILTKSGSHSLDKKALKTVLALSGEYPHLRKKVDLQIPISFSLKNS
jgi:periplasmic protein TonB